MTPYPSTIKSFAFIFMALDHIGLVFFPDHSIFRLLGRFAFPLFALMTAQGFLYTKNLTAYFDRLLFLFLISQPIFLFLIYHGLFPFSSVFNVLLTLSLGLLCVSFYDKKLYVTLFFCIISLFFFDYMGLKLSYGLYGVLLVLTSHIFRSSFYSLFLSSFALSVIFHHLVGLSFHQILAPFALFFAFIPYSVPVNFHRFGYFFYPGHLLAIYILHQFLS